MAPTGGPSLACARAGPTEPGWGVTLESDGAGFRLFDGSRAAEAGLRLGDRVTAIGGRPSWTEAQYVVRPAFWTRWTDGGASVTVARDGASTVVVVPGGGLE